MKDNEVASSESVNINRILIVGGGTSGWMTAVAVAHLLKNGYADITLVESEEIGIIGVGEATIPQAVNFQRMLGLDENEFIAATNATFKLGIEFVNWSNPGSRYIHPFGGYGQGLDGVDFHHFWLRQRSLQRNKGKAVIPLDSYSLQAMAAKANKFMRPIVAPNSPLGKIAYAFQFDAVLYSKYLREVAESKGVKRIEGKIVSTNLRSADGFIESVQLESGETIAADLFIDCSGFRGVLIEGALKTGYEEWTKWLPCDRAVAVPCESSGPPEPYTRATAHSAGWQWHIPLQNRVGNGHVYSSSFMETQVATDVLLGNLDGKPLADPRHLRFVTGRRKKFWNKNCVAIGLSAGFLEPLESTSIHLAQSAIAKLLAFFPRTHFDPLDSDMFNKLTVIEYERVRDFIILHYKLTKRDDTEFWNYVRNMDVPEYLTHKMEMYRRTGRIIRQDEELFTDTNWLAVFEGQGLEAQSWHAVADTLSAAELEQRLAKIASAVANSAEYMPTHSEYIAQHCAVRASG
jgi:tryptophan 7-halogenase